MLCYTFARVLFVNLNYNEFNIPYFFSGDFFRLFIGGMRFDATVFSMTNAVFLFFAYFPLHYLSNIIYQKVLGYIFVISNSLFLMLNFVDIAYFPYIHKRMQRDVFQFMDGKHGDEFFDLLPGFFVQFWYLFLLFIVMVWLIWKANNSIQNIRILVRPSFINYLKSIVFFISLLLLLVIGVRGGLQYRPVDIINASEMTEVKNIPVILNSPFTMIKSFSRDKINFQPPDSLKFSDNSLGIINPSEKSLFKKYNIVIIIIEGLSKKYVGYFSGNKATPFLDSMMDHSLIFPNAFANSKSSMEGIPAILASIPSWMDDPFIYSFYSGNNITSVASLLKPKGYSTSFFHGGKNGTMGFDSFCKLAGIDNYYGRNEYGDEKDFDGNWGIWDEPFMQFAVKKMSESSKPFVSAIFTLNTHHPFTIPEKYKEKFKQEGHPLMTCIRYTDHALQRFFEEAAKTDWYKNTIFVITADHTALDIEGEENTAMNDYRIPIIFFSPDGKLKNVDESVASQIDILPTLMSIQDYPQAYFSFGKSLIKKSEYRYSINYKSGIYQFIDSEYLYQFNGQKCVGFFDWKQDTLLRNDLKTDKNKHERFKNELVKQLGFFTYCVEKNKMSVKK
jgi:phosphoglycerol transferase MdoB-like AlkP superfamily enzyme